MLLRYPLVRSGLLIAALLATNCERRDTPAALLLTQEDREFLDQAKAKEGARRALQRTPAVFIHAGKWDKFDKGIINSYTRSTAIEFTNESQFDVADIQGKITFVNEQGQEMATVPFKAEGELPARTSARLNVTSGEISGSATKAQIVVESVRIRG